MMRNKAVAAQNGHAGTAAIVHSVALVDIAALAVVTGKTDIVKPQFIADNGTDSAYRLNISSVPSAGMTFRTDKHITVGPVPMKTVAGIRHFKLRNLWNTFITAYRIVRPKVYLRQSEHYAFIRNRRKIV